MIKNKNISTIVGLGNPGPKFFYTPHNIGFLVLDRLAERFGSSWIEKQNMLQTTVQIHEKSILLVKPQTFMNSSGQVFAALAKRGISLDHVVVIHDEIDFDFGKISIKEGGSARGHNGLRSIIEHAGADFLRIRCGVGRPDDPKDVGDFVTAKFVQSPEQIDALIDAVINVVDGLVV
jgi:PTH1 family peptidyl-tRNA hydrolase